VSSAVAAPIGQQTLQHFVFFGLERDRIKEANLLESAAFPGAHLKYTWKELEPEKDKYDTGLVVRDLEFLQSNGKKLFIQAPGHLVQYRKGPSAHSYPLIRGRAKGLPAGVALQWGNYDQLVPDTHQRITVQEIHRFGRDVLRLDYIFWCTQEPSYSKDVMANSQWRRAVRTGLRLSSRHSTHPWRQTPTYSAEHPRV